MANYKYDLTVNVMMVGGRRCGKTSVLAAMQNCFASQLRNTSLVTGPAGPDVLDVIEAKNQEIDGYFKKRGRHKDFTPDDNPTGGIREYPFYVGIKDRNNRICINFIDYPGEWLTDKEHWDELENRMKQSRILLIAIDTPHLMEEDGIYNDAKNRCMRITQMVKDIGFADNVKGEGMILFVPLKCERYYIDGRIDEVTAEVKKVYKPLMEYIYKPGMDQSNSNAKITVGITPIQTMGSAEFSRFALDDNYDIKVNRGVPACAIYQFIDQSKDGPEPKYCEQPLLYILAFVLDKARKVKEKRKKVRWPFRLVLDFFEDALLNWASAEDYQKQSAAIKDKIKQDGDGYAILSKGILKLH